MRCIRASFPEAHITLMTDPLYARFMSKSVHIDDFFQYRRQSRLNLLKQWRLKKSLQAEGFDMVFDLQNSDRSGQYHGWLKPAFICGRSRHATAGYTPDFSRKLSAVDYLAEQVALAGVDVSAEYRADVSWAADDVEAVMQQAGVKPGFVLLIPGASAKHPQKRWPYYAALSQALTARGLQTVTAPGPDEIDLCASLPATALFDNGKPLTFNQLVVLSAHCALVVGNDTGPTHLMAASNTQGVALFGGLSPAHNTGVSAVYQVLEKPDIADISLDEVLAKIDQITG